MTGTTENDTDWQDDLVRQQESARAAGDPDLARLVQLANAYGVEQPLVLSLAGQTLTGTVVSGRTYFDRLADAVQGDDPEDTMRGSLAAGYRRRGEDFAAWGAAAGLGGLDPEGPDDDRLPELPAVAYVHLRDVQVVTSPSSPRIPLWRGRLSEVVGWSVGRLSG